MNKKLQTPIFPPPGEPYTDEVVRTVKIEFIGYSNGAPIYRGTTIRGLGREKNGIVEVDDTTMKNYNTEQIDSNAPMSFIEFSDFIKNKHVERELNPEEDNSMDRKMITRNFINRNI